MSEPTNSDPIKNDLVQQIMNAWSAERPEGDKNELGIDFWLKFPVRVRPLKFVPGRNRQAVWMLVMHIVQSMKPIHSEAY